MDDDKSQLHARHGRVPVIPLSQSFLAPARNAERVAVGGYHLAMEVTSGLSVLFKAIGNL